MKHAGMVGVFSRSLRRSDTDCSEGVASFDMGDDALPAWDSSRPQTKSTPSPERVPRESSRARRQQHQPLVEPPPHASPFQRPRKKSPAHEESFQQDRGQKRKYSATVSDDEGHGRASSSRSAFCGDFKRCKVCGKPLKPGQAVYRGYRNVHEACGLANQAADNKFRSRPQDCIALTINKRTKTHQNKQSSFYGHRTQLECRSV